MRYRFIEAKKELFPIQVLSSILRVSRSGYFAWRGRPESKRSMDNRRLVGQIQTSHRRSDRTYGSPRVWKDLMAQGIQVGRHRVTRLMQQEQLRSKRRRRFRVTTNANHRWPVASQLSGTMVIDALQMAIKARRPAGRLIHHSDQGVQYASGDFQRLLARHQIQCSMSRRGDCWDNAATESFFATLKTERTNGQGYSTRDEAREDVFEFIEVFYNRQRRHSALGYLSPCNFEHENAT